MRIVIDLQGRQDDGRFCRTEQDSLALALAIARNCGEHTVILALNGLFPESIESVRSFFDGLLPQENIRIWYAPSPVRGCQTGNGWRREIAECIREAFLASLQPDIVHISNLYEGDSDYHVASIGIFAPSMATSVMLHDLIPPFSPEYPAPNSAYTRYYAGKIEQMKQATVWLSLSATTAKAAHLAPGFDSCHRIEFLDAEDVLASLTDRGQQQSSDPIWDLRARRALAIFTEIHASRGGASRFENLDSLSSRLIDSIAPLIPHGTQKSDLTAIARAIAMSLPENREKRLFVDISGVIQKDAKTGIQRVTRSILKEFLANPPDGYQVEPVYATLTRHGYRYARHYTASLLAGEYNGNDEDIEHRSGDIFLGLDLQHQTVINHHDYLLGLRQDGVKVVFIVYDLLPISMPLAFKLEPGIHERWLDTITDFDGAACISRAVADELTDWLAAHKRQRLRPFLINWFHLGADIESSLPTFGLPDDAGVVLGRIARAPSFLMVGTMEPRKGHQQTLDAFEQLWARGVKANLVIVGQQGWKMAALIKRLQQHPLTGTRLFWLKGISDEYLEKIYAAAACLIAASEGEGFGLPLVEAARHQLPIIARGLPVFREIAGKHALYFNGLQPDELAATVENWLALAKAVTIPPSSGIQWLTWADSAAQLQSRICGDTGYRQWPPAGKSIEDHTRPGDKPTAPDTISAQENLAQVSTPKVKALMTTSQPERTAIPAFSGGRLNAPLCLMAGLARRVVKALYRPSPAATISDHSARVILKPSYPLRDAWYDGQQPEVSLIVLNFDKPNLTLACLDSLWEHTHGYRYEIVLVDNGSEAKKFRKLAPAQVGARIVRLEVNRFFGEGNNIGFEASRGRYVVFLNNDIRATPGWLAPLIRLLADDPGIGAAGPKMVSPAHILQEAGAEIRADGSANRFGRGGDPDDPAYDKERDVMYVSAAALAMRRESFEQALGFDLCYEPAYYEDYDLCLKILQMGLRVTYCPDSCIVHHEHATTNDLAAELKPSSLIPLNRERFLTRWQPILTGEARTVTGLIPPPAGELRYRKELPSVLLYTPYNLVPGGGERYLLTIAAGLIEVANVTLATEHPFSRLRLRTMGRELSLDLNGVRIITLDQAAASANYEWTIVMGNEALPAIPGQGRHNIFLCQFPFPRFGVLHDRMGYAEEYEQVIVYSTFVKRHYTQALGQPLPQITIISPPVPLAPFAPDTRKKPIILGVGRFFTGGHAKRQDLMIDAFRRLTSVHPGVELHLAGTLPAESKSRDYFTELQHQGARLPVFFHPNVSPQQLARLYAEASIYWHLSGYGVDEARTPHRCEHFGITVLEAMSAGCIPLVINRGGPPETVDNGVNGYVLESLDELVEISLRILSLPADDARIVAMRNAAITTSRRFSPEHFINKIRSLMKFSVVLQ